MNMPHPRGLAGACKPAATNMPPLQGLTGLPQIRYNQKFLNKQHGGNMMNKSRTLLLFLLTVFFCLIAWESALAAERTVHLVIPECGG
ncbi:Uncharacterized protein dnm_037320 [Desulfonema magnum]|uniref:Uncharacterized protein n=1 Tax=Desulfonema magnum TaxID=45655 RepID=A0A975BLM0_9BACT|nr:Uncharacterized protein dnm_037320 [Desulfonema magnum]